jgi:hypothetical protein
MGVLGHDGGGRRIDHVHQRRAVLRRDDRDLASEEVPAGEATEFPVTECIHPKSQTPAILDRIGLWTVVGIVLIAIAYIPVFLTHNYEFTSRGFYLWGP